MKIKRSLNLKKYLRRLKYNNDGQMTVFFGVLLVIIFSLLAFIINVGLFVKAKINLQNAVDAGAYAGAAVQARQLTNMAYLNWEMRNVYKEWMFKYYVLGQLANDDVLNADATGSSMNFRNQPFDTSVSPNLVDPYNLPSICIHVQTAASTPNICGLFSLPGLPRFTSPGLPSVAEINESFIDALSASKADDCSRRSDLNFGTALNWAFGTRQPDSGNIPLISADRPGAWVSAIELAMRMRNLEFIMNQPPEGEPICASSGENCQTVNSLDSIQGIALKERPVKAFMSAFRSLSGGESKETGDDELSRTFTLTELAPTPFVAQESSLSGFLIPSSKSPALTKHYVDLQAFPINLVTFFTSFIAAEGDLQGIKTDADCTSQKTALPVPGYIFGFHKNPKVVTYYAVKGNAKFIGLFYPFTEQEGIELSAYAAAKPFGGRIGPKLFNAVDSQVRARETPAAQKSAPYVSALDVAGLGTGFRKGFPFPLDESFWVTAANPLVGGNPLVGNDVFFGVPNLLFTFQDFGDLSSQNVAASNVINTLERANTFNDGQNPSERFGLYDPRQMNAFASLLNSGGATTLSSDQINAALEASRQATPYEALNYLIPYHVENGENVEYESQPSVESQDVNIHGNIRYNIYAPLIDASDQLLYNNNESVVSTVQNFLRNNENSVDTFVTALKSTSDAVRAADAGNSNRAIYDQAANTIYAEPLDISGFDATACATVSLAQKFNHFFKGNGTACDLQALPLGIEQYLNTLPQNGETFYPTTYFPINSKRPNGMENDTLMTAYMPGERQGASRDGDDQHPIGLTPDGSKVKRNNYSVKFVPLDMFLDSQTNSANSRYTTATALFETDNITGFADQQGNEMTNTLNQSDLSEFLDGNNSVLHN